MDTPSIFNWAFIPLLILGPANAAFFWFQGRQQRQDNPSLAPVQKRIILWFLIGLTVPFLFLTPVFLSDGIFGFFQIIRQPLESLPFLASITSAFAFTFLFAFYVFARGGAEELSTVSPMFGKDSGLAKKPRYWKFQALAGIFANVMFVILLFGVFPQLIGEVPLPS